jgi:hypothetical protein
MRDFTDAIAEALDAAQQEVGHCLVRVGSAHHHADIRLLTDAFALDGLGANAPQPLQVQLRLPSRQEMLGHMARHLPAAARPASPDEQAALLQAANEALAPYYTGDTAKAWMQQVSHDGISILFEGVPHNNEHILNRAHAHIAAHSPLTTGMAEEAIKRLHPEASEAERQKHNRPHNRNRLMAINGAVLLHYQEQDIDLRAKFSHAVELVSAQQSLPAEDTALHPYIKIGTLDASPTTLRVNNLHQVTCGTGYFAKPDLPPAGALRAALLHEHAHVLNGDLASPALVRMQQLAGLSSVKGKAAIGRLHPNLLAEPLLRQANGDVSTALAEIDAMRSDLQAIEQAVQPLYASLQSAPWLAGLDGHKAAADMEGEQQLVGAISALPEADIPTEAAQRFVERTNQLLRYKPAEDEPAVSDAKMEPLRDALAATYADYAPLLAGLEVFGKIGSALNHASEFRADSRAAAALDNPQDLEAMLRWARGDGDTSVGSFSHPSIDARVARLRAEKPVLGNATATLMQRAAAAQDRGI